MHYIPDHWRARTYGKGKPKGSTIPTNFAQSHWVGNRCGIERLAIVVVVVVVVVLSEVLGNRKMFFSRLFLSSHVFFSPSEVHIKSQAVKPSLLRLRLYPTIPLLLQTVIKRYRGQSGRRPSFMDNTCQTRAMLK